MNLRPGLLALTLVNVALLAASLLQQMGPALAQAEPPVLRARALEIVDAQGRVRASLEVLPARGPEAETVLLRLITERGRPSVKIAASELTSGLSFAGPTGTKDTWITLGSSGTTSALRLRNEDGREQVVRP